MLSADLQASLGGAEDSQNVAVLSSTFRKKKGKGKGKGRSLPNTATVVARPHNSVPSRKKSQRGAEAVLEARKVTKRKRKRLEKLAVEKQKKERRAALFNSISRRNLQQHERRLLEPSAKIGAKESKREKLRKALLFSRAGIGSPTRHPTRMAASFSADSSSPSVQTSRGQASKAATLLVPRRPEDSSDGLSSSSSEAESESEPESKSEAASGSVNGSKSEPMPEAPSVQSAEPNPSTSAVSLLAASPGISSSNSSLLPASPAISSSERQAAVVVRVQRPANLQARRAELPVARMEQEIMELIGANAVTVLCGETGSGKTTQVPQFLFEAGYGWDGGLVERSGVIGVTQPRRVATIGMARRVAQELGTKLYDLDAAVDVEDGFGGSVGYQIRYDARTMRRGNRLKFMTDGVLLREAREDILLRKYSVVVLDEAHERNLNTDILLGILSRIIPLRERLHREGKAGVYPLRLVIMSATLRVDDFVANHKLFPPPRIPPVLNVESRQYPVNIHFSRRTELYDYLRVTFKKTCAIHRRLPPGGILVFLTGQREIEWLCEALTSKFGRSKASSKEERLTPSAEESDVDYSDFESEEEDAVDDSADKEEENVQGLAEASGGRSEKKRVEMATESVDVSFEAGNAPMRVLPLYSRLPTAKQMAVFDEVEDGVRLVVVATNVAETSVTIPGIKYVVDCGREKRKTYNQRTGISTMKVTWVSKASARQRSGRAGRVAAGHCYRLYSSAVFNDRFEDFAQPEISTLPIEDVVLYMKSMRIQRIANFPFVTPPDPQALTAAMSTLQQLGALRREVEDAEGEITVLGERISKFPLRARLAKMLVVATHSAVTSPEQLSRVVSIVAGLSLQSPFLHLQALEGNKANDANSSSDDDEGSEDSDEDNQAKKARRAAEGIHSLWADPSSDFMSLLRAIGAYLHARSSSGYGGALTFCKSHMLHQKTMEEICKLRWQLAKLVAQVRCKEKLTEIEEDSEDLTASSRPLARRIAADLTPPSTEEELALSQVIVAGLLDKVARKMSKEEARAVVTQGGGDSGAKASLSRGRWPYQVCNSSIDQPVYIHQHSNLFSPNSAELPDYVVYNEIITVERTNNKRISYMRQLQRVESSWLFELSKGTDQCKLSAPLDQPSPRYSSELDGMEACVHPVYGPRMWRLPAQWLPFPVELDSLEDTLRRGGWFARALLDGSIFPAFEQLRPTLAIPPAYATRKPYDKRVHALVQALSLPEPRHSKAALVSAWRDNPSYLKAQVCSWMKKEERKPFVEAGKWATMIRSLHM